MNYNLISAQRDQIFLLPPAFADWLPSDHLVYQVIDAVEEMDMEPFLQRYNPDGVGQAAFDPALMVALLLFGYCVGERSSRRLERHCYEHVAFRVVTGNRQPHFTTIARFRREHEAALASVFVKVLDLCARAGLIDLSLLAIDGTKIAANAALAANRDEKWIDEQVRQILAEAEATDAAEDQEYGERRGDELPGACADREQRLMKLQAAKKELEAQQDARLVEFATRVLERKGEEQATGHKKRGRKPEPLPAPENPQVNLTDPQSRIMKDSRGFLQGYNAQAVVSADQIIVAAQVTQEANDV
jgi:transposase